MTIILGPHFETRCSRYLFVDISSQFSTKALRENPSMFVGQRAGWTQEEEALLSVPAIETRAPVIEFMTEFPSGMGYPGCCGQITDQT